MANSIKDMVIRGAPAIGIAAAYGIALGVAELQDARSWDSRAVLDDEIQGHRRRHHLDPPDGGQPLLGGRAHGEGLPENIMAIIRACAGNCSPPPKPWTGRTSRSTAAIGRNGQELLQSGDTVLTHCNAGALATAGYGTALGVVRAAVEAGKKIKVIADETRPYLQGARLTVWELQQDGIPVTLITDNMAGQVMKKGMVQAVIVGADRIAANGDTANKIGTYSLAVLAKYHGIPFYVAAPLSTIDLADRRRRQHPHRGAGPGGSDEFPRPDDGAAGNRCLQPGLRRHAGRADHGHHHRGKSPLSRLRPGHRRPERAQAKIAFSSSRRRAIRTPRTQAAVHSPQPTQACSPWPAGISSRARRISGKLP